MNAMEIVEEFQNRVHSARAYREVAALMLVVSIVLFTLYGIYRTQIGLWSGAVLAAGVMCGVAAFTLAVMSYLKLRCPNCDRVLGEVNNAAYCPYCGAVLKSDTVGGLVTMGAPKRAGSGKAVARRAAPASSARVWEPRSGTRGGDDFPEEAYPKNIRMFTTPNEMELTKRYIQLIDKDNRNLPASESARLTGRAAKTARNILPEKAASGESAAAGVRRPRGILGSLSMETIIAIAAGAILLTVILMVAFGALQ
jgi:Zn finger protein HypA/HybF involved in hydrogenase expression